MSRPGWLYCFRTYGFTKDSIPIYKVGRTTRANPQKRLNEFNGSNRVKRLLFCSYFHNISVESYVLHELRRQEWVTYLDALGREYFSCTDDITMMNTVKLITSEWETDSFDFDKEHEKLSEDVSEEDETEIEMDDTSVTKKEID